MFCSVACPLSLYIYINMYTSRVLASMSLCCAICNVRSGVRIRMHLNNYTRTHMPMENARMEGELMSLHPYQDVSLPLFAAQFDARIQLSLDWSCPVDRF